MDFLIDTHSHLTLCEEFISLEDQLADARKIGLKKILDPGLHPSDFLERKRKLSIFPEVLLGLALAPHHSSDFKESDFELLETLCREEKPVALSEIGLEYLLLKDNHAFQRDLLARQLALAKSCDLPVFLHVREAYHDTHEVVKTSTWNRGAVHCFTGTWEDAKKFLDLGFYISFSGIVTFKNAKELQDVARLMPLDRMLTETDAPYLAPTPMRGKKNVTSYVRYTNAFLAELRGIPLSEMNQQLWENAQTLLKF
jgi:TatD DNase family protein